MNKYYGPELWSKYNHVVPTIRTKSMKEFDVVIRACGLPFAFVCPCGQTAFINDKAFEDDAVFVCSKCGDWHVISWRNAA
jgi:transcription initiation factor IIE alpha subunit